ncbi:FecR family protein [Parapedobacter tibetensis]|uniref:FecR family protein n=1 Tax=Parapedobacter tibetensis TaxID=2972951 RepID=UPI00214DA853|nr:FecR family protein [Parapedobacter tibetensis]
MSTNRRILILFQKYLANAHNHDELDELLRYFNLEEDQATLRTLVRQEFKRLETQQDEEEALTHFVDTVKQKLDASIRSRTRKGSSFKSWFTAAAILVVVLAVGFRFYFYQEASNNQQPAVIQSVGNDVLPGGSKATLTLADGHTIDLSEAQNGIIVGSESITYQDGSLINSSSRASDPTPPSRSKFGTGSNDVTLLVLTTPKGGQYQVTLSDGTNVWLNAGSTLKYPSKFASDKRVVELEGEAYFEVSHQLSAISSQPSAVGNKEDQQSSAQSASSVFHPSHERIPFLVKTQSQTVEVLGTRFNISAYPEEKETRTALMTGSVRVARPSGQSVVLKPGQEVVNHSDAADFAVRQADVDEIEAWRNGYFGFDDKSIKYIMQKVARWYDVTVIYEGDVENRKFGCMVKQSKTLVQLLTNFKQAGILDFHIEGRRLVIREI